MDENKIHNQLSSYLKSLNTYTSKQLLYDIEKGGFFSFVLMLGFWPLYPNLYQDTQAYFSRNPNIKTKDVNECASILFKW